MHGARTLQHSCCLCRVLYSCCSWSSTTNNAAIGSPSQVRQAMTAQHQRS
jgi:hypothetical protein